MNIEKVDFSKIDSHLKTDYLETKMREMLVELVMPIIMLAKKNLIHNANKNSRLEELKEGQ